METESGVPEPAAGPEGPWRGTRAEPQEDGTVPGAAHLEPKAAGKDGGEGPRSVRPNGILVIVALVVAGVAVTAGYMQWKAPEVGEIIANRRREVAAAPKTTEGRLGKWLDFGAPMLHQRLQLLRFSAEQPWLVTHAVGADPLHLAIHGIDLAAMPKDLAWIDGTTVRVHLPRPTLLATGPLSGPNAISVPVAANEGAAPDEIARARYLIDFALNPLSDALERDIPGAHLSIEIGPETNWDSIPASRPTSAPR